MAIYEPLSNRAHRDLKLKEKRTYFELKDQHLIPVTVTECLAVGSELPLVFVKGAEPDRFEIVAMTSLRVGGNEFIDDTGSWKGRFVPNRLLSMPFAWGPAPDNPTQAELLIDIEGEQVGNQGETLFDENNETELLVQIKEMMKKQLDDQALTRSIVDHLNKLNLIRPYHLKMNINGQEQTVQGIYIITEEALSALSDQNFLDLHKRNLLKLVYCHQRSLQHAHQLALFAQEK